MPSTQFILKKLGKLFINTRHFDRILQITGCQTVHCLGDSHTEIFRYIAGNYLWFHTRFKFCVVQGASGMGLANPKSKTNALSVFKTYIKPLPRNEGIIFCLGEVDCGFVIWYRAQKYGVSIEEQFELSLRNYLSFVDYAKLQGFETILILSAPLPTIIDNQDWGEVAQLRRDVKATLRQRTDLTMKYNERLRSYSQKKGYIFLDIEKDILDSKERVIAERFRHPDPLNHHLNEKPTAQLLIPYLKSYGYW